ncbi:putative ribonuclease H-like domain-containing protein [Tanacetum coccineum]|uniref:Ribonuclease H-like domain-containing protein n=1 Tax=Tanacetum coccineum TaxID=301880 RepID=A0ABQ4XA70_9ASTR
MWLFYLQVVLLAVTNDAVNSAHVVPAPRAPRNQGNRNKDAPTRIVPIKTPTNALVVQDGIGGYDWSFQAEEDITNFALMAYTSQGSSSSNSEVHTCSKDCLKSYETLQKQYDQQRDALKKSNLEIIGYQLGLESLESRIVVHQKNEAVYDEDMAFLKYEVKVRDNSITELKNQLAEALREKDDLKNLKLDNEVFKSASDSSVNEIEEQNNQVNDRFKKVKGYHAVPPLYTRNYMPSRPDLFFVGLDDSIYKTNVSETISSVPRIESTASMSSKDSLEQPKTVRPGAPIIEEQAENLRKSQSPGVDEKLEWNNDSETKGWQSQSVLAWVPKEKLISLILRAWYNPDMLYRSRDFLIVDALGYMTGYNKSLPYSLSRTMMVDLLHLQEVLKELLNESQVLLKVPKQNNMYNFDRKNVDPSGGLTCLFAKAIIDESNLWHRRLGHINFKTMNKLVRGNLVRGLPSKLFENDHSCIVCQKGKQHKASCKTMLVSSICHPLQMLHMELFGPTSVRSINHKTYYLVSTDDYRIKREFSVARTPQQNEVVERKNRTLIEAVRTMLSDSLLPTTFWAKAVNTGCYIQSRVLVTKPHNKTSYELLHGNVGFLGFFGGFSINSNAFRVFNTRSRKVKENLHKNFLVNKPNVAGSGPEWLFDIDSLTKSMNHEPVTAGNQTNKHAGIKDNADVVPTQQYILLPLLYDGLQSSKDVVANDAGKKTDEEPAHEGKRNGQEKERGASSKENDQNVQVFKAELDNLLVQQKEGYANSTNRDSTVSPSVSTADGAYDDEDVGAEADLNNLGNTMNVSHIPTTRIHKDHPKDKIIRDINLATQTRRMIKIIEEHAEGSGYIKSRGRGNHKDYQNCLFACFLSQKEPKKVIQALDDRSWIEAMQEELLQFKLQKKDKRGIVVRNKARLVAQGYTQEEGIDYDEVFALVARIESNQVEKALYGLHQAPRAWYETLTTYLLENRFRRGTIDKTLFIKKDKCDILLVQVYVDDIIFGSTKKSLCVEFEQTMHKRFHMSFIGELTFFLGLQKFDFITVKTPSTPIETNKALLKDEEFENVDVHIYRSMIGSLMHLTSSRPDIMFVVCACARFQVTPKVSHLHAVKRIFRYLKGQPKLGLWYPKDSPFYLEAFSDSDYAGASLDRKLTPGGCQFLGKRLISWQCKKQTIVANSTTKAEYVAAANCCGHNPVFHSKTKHIEIRHHFIRDSYEKRLIQVIKIHTDHNVADLLTKAFDVGRFQYLTASIGMLNP